MTGFESPSARVLDSLVIALIDSSVHGYDVLKTVAAPNAVTNEMALLVAFLLVSFADRFHGIGDLFARLVAELKLPFSRFNAPF